MDTYVAGESEREQMDAQAEAVLGRAHDLFENAVQGLTAGIRARPATALLIAIGLGVVVGRLLKRGG